jgi:hypothetical protein
MSTFPTARTEDVARLSRRALGVGAAALLACAAGAPFSPAQFFRAYLTAYLFYLGIALGSLVALMVYHLTGGAWGFLIRRTLEAATRTLPLLALLFMPVALGLAYVYPWAEPGAVLPNKELQRWYLNPPLFWVRAAIYFVAWIAFASVFNAWSRRQDHAGDPALVRRMSGLAGPALVVYGLTITFASVDWVMSLQPEFRSTIFGPVFASGQLLSGLAFALLVLARLTADPRLSKLLSLEALNDLGNLLLTFLVIWAYLVWFQFMLIWIANLPYEVVWYVARARGAWRWVGWSLVVFHFAVPFFLLLMRGVKRDPAALAQVAGLILFMQLVFMNYQVLPAFPDTPLTEHWMDFLTPVGLGGLWLAYFVWQLGREPLLPLRDPNQEAALHYHHADVAEAAREQEVSRG